MNHILVSEWTSSEIAFPTFPTRVAKLLVSLVGSGFLACGKVKKALKTRGKSWAFTMTSSAELLLLIPRLNRLKPWTVWTVEILFDPVGRVADASCFMLQFQFVFFEILSLPKRQRVPPYWGTPNSAFPHRSRRFELDKPPAALVDWCWSQRFETTVKTLGKALRINLGIRGSCLRFFASCKRAVRISRASSSGSCLARKFTRPAISEARKCLQESHREQLRTFRRFKEIQGDSRTFQEPGALTSPYRPKLPSLICKMDAKLPGGRPKVNIAGDAISSCFPLCISETSDGAGLVTSTPLARPNPEDFCGTPCRAKHGTLSEILLGPTWNLLGSTSICCVFCHVCLFPECVARVPVSFWGSGGGGCVRLTLRLRRQPSATVRSRPQVSVWGPYGRAYGKFCNRLRVCKKCRKSFCVAGTILLRCFQKRSTLETSIVILRRRRSN